MTLETYLALPLDRDEVRLLTTMERLVAHYGAGVPTRRQETDSIHPLTLARAVPLDETRFAEVLLALLDIDLLAQVGTQARLVITRTGRRWLAARHLAQEETLACGS